MADRIKGITVQIGGDTTDLSQSLKEINQESRQIGSELSDVQRLLKFNPQSAELLEQRQELLNRQIQITNRRLTELRQVEHQVQEQFQRGDIGEQQFRAFQREIIATEGRLRHFERQAQETSRTAKKSFKEMGSSLANSLAGAAAGMGIGEIINKALESTHEQTQIKIGFDVPPDQVGKVTEIVNSVKAYGVDAEASMEGVRRQFALNKDASAASNEAIVKGAAAITTAYGGIDFTELIQETNEMAGSLGMSQEQAMGMVNSLLKAGFPPDQLDIITEYGAQLKRAGYNAEEIQGIFAAGVDTKSWNIDKLLDGIKEGRIRLANFGAGVDKTTAGLIKGTDISKQELQKWGKAVAEGGDGAKVAMGEVATKLAGIDDATLRNKIGVQLFGTMWEDTGSKITDTMLNYKKHTQDAKKDQQGLNDTVKKMDADPQNKLNKALQDMNTALLPLLTQVANFVSMVADWVEKNPELATTILAIVVGIGILVGLIIGALPFILGLITAFEVAAAVIGAILSPVGLVILAILALVAIIIYCALHWSEIKKKAKAEFDELVTIVKGLGAKIKAKFLSDLADFVSIWVNMGRRIKQKFNDDVDQLKQIGHKIGDFLRNIDLKQIGHDIMQGFLNGITGMAKKIWSKAKEIADGVGKWLKKALKTSSPSKVTYEIGKDTGAGLQLGLEDSISAIKNASLKLSGAAINNIAPTNNIASQSIGAKNVNVTINSPKALDVREANRQFANTMNKMALMW
jgi:phage-related minor tail protein